MADELTTQGIAALKAGDKTRALELFVAAISANPKDERAWLWLSGAVEADAARIDCLQRVLAINPDNEAARIGLEALGAQSEPPRVIARASDEHPPKPDAAVSTPLAAPPQTSDNWLAVLLSGVRELLHALIFTSQFGAARWLAIPAVLGLCVCLCLMASGQFSSSSPPLEGQPAPDFTLDSMAGTSVRLSDLRGQVVLVNFWATWCGYCLAELPDLAAVYQEHQAEGFVVLGVDTQESIEQVGGFLKSNYLPYPILLDMNGKVARAYRVSTIPMSFLIDRRGVMRVVLSGQRSRAALEETIGPLLAEKP